MEDLIEKSLNQNFIPVVDDRGVFIGIVKRKAIIQFCYERYKTLEAVYGPVPEPAMLPR